MSDALVLDVPMELGLPLMPAIRAHRMDAEGELYVYLYLMARDLFGVATGMGGSPADISWQANFLLRFKVR